MRLSKIMGCNSGRCDRYIKYLYAADPWKSWREAKIRPSRIWNLIMPYSGQKLAPGSRELYCKSTDAVRITSNRAAGASVCGLVYIFAIAQRHNFVAIRASVIAFHHCQDLSYLTFIRVSYLRILIIFLILRRRIFYCIIEIFRTDAFFPMCNGDMIILHK